MALGGLGAGKKTFRLPILELLSAGMVLAAIILFALELVRFSQARDVVQTDVTVAGVPVTGLKQAEAVSTWERVFGQPVQLDFRGYPILLNPAEIGFRTNSELMLSDLRAKAAGTDNYWGDFINYLWRRPTNPIAVELSADYQEAKLRNFLQDIADRYEQRASGASFDPNALTFGAGADGQQLDIEASIKAIDGALRRPAERKVKLIMKGERAAPVNMDTLKKAIQDYFTAKGFDPAGQNTLASVVILDLQNGQELVINGDIAYSAVSTIKIPIMLTIFKRLNLAPDVDTKWLMGASILCSSNSASNYLMQISGTGGNARDQLGDGLKQTSITAQSLGAKNTFIRAPLWVGAKDYEFSIQLPKTTPNAQYNAQPDPYSQTTAEDMANLLLNIYDCAEYGSGLLTAYPDGYTQNECKQMVELMSGNIIGRMIELGVPPGTRVAHKNGWGKVLTGYNSSDAAIVYTPGGNYIISIYMWEKLKPGQDIGSLLPWEIIEGISRITYNYFNPDQPMLITRVPENPLGAVDCVMPNPNKSELLDLNNINNGRFDSNGNIVPDACYNYPQCQAIPIKKTGSLAPVTAPTIPPAGQPGPLPTSPPIQQPAGGATNTPIPPPK